MSEICAFLVTLLSMDLPVERVCFRMRREAPVVREAIEPKRGTFKRAQRKQR